MTWVQYILSIIVTIACSWAITRIAIKLLFYPKKTIKILGINIQGIIPHKHDDFISKSARWISEKFISFKEIEEKVINPDHLQQLRPEIEKHIDAFLKVKLKEAFPMLSVFIGEKTIRQLKEAFLKELETLFPVLMKNYLDKLQRNIDLEKIIATKLSAISVDKLEEIFNSNLKRPILLFGIFLGLLTGIIQLVFNTLVFY